MYATAQDDAAYATDKAPYATKPVLNNKKTTARRTFLLRRAVVIWYRNALLCGSHFGQHLEGALHDGIAVGLTVGLGHVDPATL